MTSSVAPSRPSWALVPQTPDRVHSFRRALPGATDDDLVRPKTIPLPGKTSAQNHHENSGNINRVRIVESNDANHPAGRQYGDAVQYAFRPATPDQALAYSSLKRVNGVVTAGSFAVAHGCSAGSAARWLRFFTAKGVLRRRVRGIGHEIVGGGK